MFSSMSFLFLLILCLSTLIALSTDNWFQMWAALEINMMMFIPLMFNKDNLSINSMMKYFIIQAFASSLFIMSMIISQKFNWGVVNSNFIVLAMTMKLGLFPIFFWFPQVSEGLTWMGFTILSTWQKIIPLYILSSSSKMMFSIIISASALIGCLSMLNQTSLRKLFAYSSLTHMSWMMLSMINSNTGWFNYFLIYSLIMISIYLVLSKMNISSLDNIKHIYSTTNFLSLLIIMMSLGGLPPFLGFLPKWLIISNTSFDMYFLLFTLIISSLVSIFVYLRITFPLLFNQILKTKKTMNMNFNLPTMINTIMLIPLVPMILF